MGLASLKLESANLDALIGEELRALDGGVVEPESVLRLCRYERQRACASLLRALDSEDFRDRLAKAGLAYLFLLDRRAALRDPDPYYLARSAGAAYLDALASGDRTLAAEIATKSTPTWTADMEDEDDFCYFAALAATAAIPPEPDLVDRTLAELARSLRGAASPRLDALRAIQRHDGSAFEEALEALLSAWGTQTEELRRSGTADPYFANIEANICVEGLALVHLARAHGLSTSESYRYLPRHALDLPGARGRPNLWEDLG